MEIADNLTQEDKIQAQTDEVIEDKGANNKMELGKFKDVGSLLNAYNSLEAEFTRRSQRLKELEGADLTKSGGESKSENSLNGENVQTEVNEFVNNFPKALKFTKQISEIAAKNKNFDKGFLQRAYAEFLQEEVTKSEQRKNDNDYLLHAVNNNPELKEQIIKDYLKSYDNSTGVHLLSDRGKGFTAPPLKPKTIEQAGLLASELLIKK